MRLDSCLNSDPQAKHSNPQVLVQYRRGPNRGEAQPIADEEDATRDWRQLGTHMLSIHRFIGSRPLCLIGMTSMIRLFTYSIFSGDGSVSNDRGVIERPVSHTLTLLGPGRSAEDYHQVRLVLFRCLTCHDLTRHDQYSEQARGRIAGYLMEALLNITGRDYVVELTTLQDYAAINRFPAWLADFRARLASGSSTRDAMATCQSEVSRRLICSGAQSLVFSN